MEPTKKDSARAKKIQSRREKRERRRKQREATKQRLTNAQRDACEAGKAGIELLKRLPPALPYRQRERAARIERKNRDRAERCNLEERVAELENRDAEHKKLALRAEARIGKLEVALASRSAEAMVLLNLIKGDMKAGLKTLKRLGRKQNKMEFWLALCKDACDLGPDRSKKLTKRQRKKDSMAAKRVRKQAEKKARREALSRRADEVKEKNLLAQQNRRKAWREAQNHWKNARKSARQRREEAGW